MVLFKSPYPSITIEEKTVPEFLWDRPLPDRPYVTDVATGREHSFKQARSLSQRLGQGLVEKLGWKKGEVMCIFSANTIDFPCVVSGVLMASGVVTPANPAYQVHELVHQLKDSGARALTTHPDNLAIALPAADQVGIPRSSVFVIEPTAKDGIQSWMSLLASKEIGFERVRKDTNVETDLAFLVYSSGTTGLAKGVMLSHRNIVSNVQMNAAVDGKYFTAETVVGAVLPFYHVFGLTCIMQLGLYKQVRLVVFKHFELEVFLQAVQKFGISFMHMAPPMVLRLAKDAIVDNYDLSSLKMINSGAAPLSASLTKEASARIKVPIKQGYGLTETSPTSNAQDWDHWEKFMGSVGPMCPNLVGKIVSEDGKELGRNEDGEIWFKGPSIMRGYLNNPSATKNALTEDGFFKTGDIGRIDDQDNLYITDRLKELIKFKGFQVAPAELEGLLLTYPDIADVGVVGVFDESQATELPRAYVVLKPGVEKRASHAKDIIAFVANRVAKHKQIRGGCFIIDQIPKSPSGKILRRVLRDRNDPLEVKARL
ncbi:hypothetical protein BCR37DRAFT_387203 [Protomyces lactucae-debilis]|uniref:Uncharacterized protein n=1 Tax=Protomyces lactucae-debilis TaxID=2754530 RepID=A0A1Y2FEY7_PROLT|nr:uncharacterized protein BCR37DRAFT_387203 [Protomyces lactucae-debilis]ORY82493.1 hypothetical protein BCR37DRAFT_387203 [Protomyces lactucae-debilis]